MESFYKTGAVALSLIVALSSAFKQREVDLPLFEEMDQVVGYYYYYYYYDGGQTVVAIIFLDVLLPICVCILIIMCVVRCIRRR